MSGPSGWIRPNNVPSSDLTAMLEHEWMRDRNRRAARVQDEEAGGDSERPDAEPMSTEQSGPGGAEGRDLTDSDEAEAPGQDDTPGQPELTARPDLHRQQVADVQQKQQAEASEASEAHQQASEPEQHEPDQTEQPASDQQADQAAADEPEDDTTAEDEQTGTDEPTDRQELVEEMDVPIKSLRDRLEQVLARQTQLPLDIEARQEVSEKAEESPREHREELVRRLLDPTLSLKEAAILLDVCRTTVRRYTNRGMLRCFRTPGNQRRFYLSDILDFMEQRQRGE